MSDPIPLSLDVESAVRDRYSAGAKERVSELCCSVSYEPKYLEAIPQNVLERDYGCGDPSKYIRAAETVLDLGSGTGKICFIASQIVGPLGRVIGVDMNADMLDLARSSAPIVAENVGYANVSFRHGKIQDLRLDLDEVDQYLKNRPVRTAADLLALDAELSTMREERPMVAPDSVDVVISNCVLNLVQPAAKLQLFAEIFRVLKHGGRAVISDIVADEDIPLDLQNDPELWSGCISGAFREDLFLRAFEDAGFHGITIEERGEAPWTKVAGIEFRSMTVSAYKGKQGPSLDKNQIDKNQAVIYHGPWKEVQDDDGHVLRRGERTAVSEKTYQLYQQRPYGGLVTAVPPRVEVADEDAKIHDSSRSSIRPPRETRGLDDETTGCEPGASCC